MPGDGRAEGIAGKKWPVDTQRQAGVWAQETQKFWSVKGASRKAREKATEATVHTLLSAALKALDLQPAPVSL